jgi:hypothetical protein
MIGHAMPNFRFGPKGVFAGHYENSVMSPRIDDHAEAVPRCCSHQTRPHTPFRFLSLSLSCASLHSCYNMATGVAVLLQFRFESRSGEGISSLPGTPDHFVQECPRFFHFTHNACFWCILVPFHRHFQQVLYCIMRSYTSGANQSRCWGRWTLGI